MKRIRVEDISKWNIEKSWIVKRKIFINTYNIIG